jgi:hypothetical protein
MKPMLTIITITITTETKPLEASLFNTTKTHNNINKILNNTTCYNIQTTLTTTTTFTIMIREKSLVKHRNTD